MEYVRARGVRSAVVGLAFVLVLGACSSTAGPGTSQASAAASQAPGTASTVPSSSGPNPVLRVGTAAALTNFADIYVAQAKGYFKQAGVDVQISTGVGANGLNMVVSGALDLLMFGTGQALIPASRGIDTNIVYNQIGAGEDAVLAVKSDSSYQTPTDLSGKRVAVLGVGGSSYGWGEYFSSYSASHGGSAYNIIQSSSVSIQVDGLISGYYDAVVSTASLLTKQMASGQVRLVVDPTTPAGEKYIPAQYVETCTFGLAQNLSAKHDAVVRFLEGMQAADTWLHQASAGDIAAALKLNKDFDGQTLATVTAGAEFDKHFYAPSLGMITPQTWQATLDQLKYWGLPGVDLTDPKFGFDQRVNMSYLQEAEAHKLTP